MPESQRQLNNISFLKGIAILGVVFVHSAVCIEDIDIYLRQVTRVGQFGCQLFFLLSGYLMMCSWNRLNNNLSFIGKTYVFYRKRIIAILPVYATVVLFYQALSFLIEYWIDSSSFYEIRHDIYSILLNLLLLHGFDFFNFNNIVPGGWFIGTIFLFYIMFPVIKVIYDNIERKNPSMLRYIPLFSVAISFIVQLLICLCIGNWEMSKRGGYLYYSVLNQLPCMLLGMNISITSIDSYMKSKSRFFVLSMTLFFCVLSLILFYVFRKEYYVFIFLPFTLALMFYYFYYYIVKLSLTTPFSKGYLYKIINRWGEMSFAIYFSNFIAGMLFPWFLILLIKSLGFTFNPTLLFFGLLPIVFLFSYIIAIPINKYIDFCKKRIS